jgi:two-component sensor histidine kinase
MSLTISPLRDANGKVVGASKIGRDITERKRSEAQISALAREAEHRAKNLLANVKAVVHLSQAATPGDLKEAIEGRIEALANVHSLFVRSHWAGAELGSLIKRELSPYSQQGQMRTLIDGPTVMLKTDLAQTIAVTLHELATNAAKYGALSVDTGRVRVEWSCAAGAGGRLVLRWTEAGGPPVNPPTRKGFSTHVMETMIRRHEGGEVHLDWHARALFAKSHFRLATVDWVPRPPCRGVVVSKKSLKRRHGAGVTAAMPSVGNAVEVATPPSPKDGRTAWGAAPCLKLAQGCRLVALHQVSSCLRYTGRAANAAEMAAERHRRRP